MSEDTNKVVKGCPVIVSRNGKVRIALSKGSLRKNQKRLRVHALDMRQCMYVPAGNFVPVTIMVEEEVAKLLMGSTEE